MHTEKHVPLDVIELIRRETTDGGVRLLLIATLAGACNAAILVLITTVPLLLAGTNIVWLGSFLLALGVYVVTTRHIYHRMTELMESALHRFKLRVADKVDKTDLAGLEAIGAIEIRDRLTENLSSLSNAASMVAYLLQTLCILLFTGLYIAWCSLTAFALITLFVVLGVGLYHQRTKQVESYLKKLARTRLAFSARFLDLLLGFKEVLFSSRRRQELTAEIERKSNSLRSDTLEANHLLNENRVQANAHLYVVLGVITLVMPTITEIGGALLGQIVTSALFGWRTLSGILDGVPEYVRSNQALAELVALEGKLDAAIAPLEEGGEDPWQGSLQCVEAVGLEYHYGGGDGFRMGPLDLTLKAGEVVFLVGGNGSGKSTFLKVLTGLYAPTQGVLRVNGIPIVARNTAAYREMISAIYSDCHIFSKLYGLSHIGADAVQVRLSQMQLQDKTSLINGRFTQVALSTGQRKRLAMIVALLEDRPFCVFDEWAADQDPEFRRYFYGELLPALRKAGKAVLVVSHDDRYFDCADRLLTMEYGVLRTVDKPNRAEATT